MATATQKQAGKSNIRKAQRSPSRPGFGRRGRAKPGTRGGGQFFRIEVAPARRFVAFRYHDVGKKRGVERIAGQRQDGTWETAGKGLAAIKRGLHRAVDRWRRATVFGPRLAPWKCAILMTSFARNWSP
jgi:hypothetical protein